MPCKKTFHRGIISQNYSCLTEVKREQTKGSVHCGNGDQNPDPFARSTGRITIDLQYACHVMPSASVGRNHMGKSKFDWLILAIPDLTENTTERDGKYQC